MIRSGAQAEVQNGGSLVETEEALLLEAARAGDPGAWRVLVDRHRPGLVRRAVRWPGAAWQEAEDHVQDGLARAWERRRSLDPRRGTFVAWVLRAGRNAGLDRARTEERRSALLKAVCPALHPVLVGGLGVWAEPEAALGRREAGEVAGRAATGLTRLERAVVLHWAAGGRATDFRHPDGKHYAPGSYRDTLSRARAKLAAWGRSSAASALAA